MEMMPSPETLDLARRILAYAPVEDKSSRPMESAVILANEKLRPYLCALVGVAGYRGLLSRALMLTREELPSLVAVQVTAEGCLQDPSELEPHLDQDRAREGGAIFLAQLLGLFISFIGEALTFRLVQAVAPHLDLTGTTKPGTPTPFETILQEVDDHLGKYQEHGYATGSSCSHQRQIRRSAGKRAETGWGALCHVKVSKAVTRNLQAHPIRDLSSPSLLP
jgi:hypothetical protein